MRPLRHVFEAQRGSYHASFATVLLEPWILKYETGRLESKKVFCLTFTCRSTAQPQFSELRRAKISQGRCDQSRRVFRVRKLALRAALLLDCQQPALSAPFSAPVYYFSHYASLRSIRHDSETSASNSSSFSRGTARSAQGWDYRKHAWPGCKLTCMAL